MVDETDTYPCPHCPQEHSVREEKCPRTHHPVPAVHRMTGRVIDDRYRVGRQIGQGAMGMVYEGEHLQLGRHLAIKFIKPQAMATEVTLQRFQNEARIAGSVGHRNIRGIVDMGTTDDNIAYIVMQYLEGRSLGEVLRDRGALPVRDSVEIAIQVLEALHAVHEKDIVHRDVKPDNIFLAEEIGGGVTVKVLDFGLSRLSRPLDGRKFELTKPGAVMGTPRYMSPEQAQCSKGVDHRTDIFSVGVLLYRMITGKKRFEEWDHESYVSAVNPENPPRPESYSPSRKLPEALAEIIMRAMAWDPESRFHSAEEFIDALAPFRFSAPWSDDAALSAELLRDSSVDLGELTRRLKQEKREGQRRGRPDGAPVSSRWLLPVALVVALAVLALAVFIVLKVTAIERKMGAIEQKTGPVSTAPGDVVRPTSEAMEVELAIEGAPEGARVYVDGVLHPERPVIITGPPDDHEVSVEAQGYKTFTRTLTITKDSTLKARMPPLK